MASNEDGLRFPRTIVQVPGTRLFVVTDMGDWKADKEATVGEEDPDNFLSHRLFLWIVPQRRDNAR